MTTEAGQYLDAIPSRHQPALHSSLVKDFAALETAVHVHPHGLERVELEAAQAIAQGVVAKGALRADPMGEIGVAQLAIQLRKAGQTKDKGRL